MRNNEKTNSDKNILFIFLGGVVTSLTKQERQESGSDALISKLHYYQAIRKK